MPTDPDKPTSETACDPLASLRERLRTQGLRPIVRSAPDMCDPQFLADLRREVAMMARHPENDAIDDGIEANRDLEGGVWDGDFEDFP
ncbi:antitoxin MazE-like protein [Rhodopseudomonas palustris]|uniref:antitoxin MazE-like protein n=1 Tax=Rhodopseudomonas palustris TaxID=1076 RepID=UPI002ACE111C|nr:antitoxin MazE-like protein [Rhodopseudomonas palustris]WQG98567.1 antitoxin MazE-like protein [Rhodopseudomonas palustris]